jgi:hypothetical protein
MTPSQVSMHQCRMKVVRTHAYEYYHQINPYCCIGKPTVFLKCPNLANTETYDSPDQAADSVTKFELAHLRQRLSVTDDDEAGSTEKLD